MRIRACVPAISPRRRLDCSTMMQVSQSDSSKSGQFRTGALENVELCQVELQASALAFPLRTKGALSTNRKSLSHSFVLYLHARGRVTMDLLVSPLWEPALFRHHLAERSAQLVKDPLLMDSRSDGARLLTSSAEIVRTCQGVHKNGAFWG